MGFPPNGAGHPLNRTQANVKKGKTIGSNILEYLIRVHLHAISSVLSSDMELEGNFT